jgi:hypothetical protein
MDVECIRTGTGTVPVAHATFGGEHNACMFSISLTFMPVGF